MKIEIITCANEELKETGFGSHLACNDVLASIQLMGHLCKLTICKSLSDLHDVIKRKPDLVILAAKYLPIEDGNDVWFSDYFEENNIIFSGSNRETLKYDSDKVLAKIHLASLGVNTARHFTAIPQQYKFEEDLPFSFPLFLKPTDAANGNGIDDQSFVENFKEFEAKVISLHDIYKQPILIEEYLGGREFTVAIIQNSSGNMTISPMELIPPISSGSLRILGFEVKTFDTEIIKKIDDVSVDSVKELAAAAFIGLGVRGFGRIDVKMDDQGKCYFMEANLIPGMNNGTSYFPRACSIENGISYDGMINLILDEAFQRVIDSQNYKSRLKPDEACLVV